MCDCLYFSWSFPPLFSSPIKLYLHSQISLLWFFLFLFPIPLAVTRRSKHFCRCLAAHQVQPTNLLHPENVFICCLSSLRQLPASQTAAENNCRTVLRESGVSPFAAIPSTLYHSLPARIHQPEERLHAGCLCLAVHITHHRETAAIHVWKRN